MYAHHSFPLRFHSPAGHSLYCICAQHAQARARAPNTLLKSCSSQTALHTRTLRLVKHMTWRITQLENPRDCRMMAVAGSHDLTAAFPKPWEEAASVMLARSWGGAGGGGGEDVDGITLSRRPSHVSTSVPRDKSAGGHLSRAASAARSQVSMSRAASYGGLGGEWFESLEAAGVEGMGGAGFDAPQVGWRACGGGAGACGKMSKFLGGLMREGGPLHELRVSRPLGPWERVQPAPVGQPLQLQQGQQGRGLAPGAAPFINDAALASLQGAPPPGVRQQSDGTAGGTAGLPHTTPSVPVPTHPQPPSAQPSAPVWTSRPGAEAPTPGRALAAGRSTLPSEPPTPGWGPAAESSAASAGLLGPEPSGGSCRVAATSKPDPPGYPDALWASGGLGMGVGQQLSRRRSGGVALSGDQWGSGLPVELRAQLGLPGAGACGGREEEGEAVDAPGARGGAGGPVQGPMGAGGATAATAAATAGATAARPTMASLDSTALGSPREGALGPSSLSSLPNISPRRVRSPHDLLSISPMCRPGPLPRVTRKPAAPRLSPAISTLPPPPSSPPSDTSSPHRPPPLVIPGRETSTTQAVAPHVTTAAAQGGPAAGGHVSFRSGVPGPSQASGNGAVTLPALPGSSNGPPSATAAATAPVATARGSESMSVKPSGQTVGSCVRQHGRAAAQHRGNSHAPEQAGQLLNGWGVRVQISSPFATAAQQAGPSA